LRRAAPLARPGRHGGRARPAPRRARDRRAARRNPARPLGVAGRHHGALLRRGPRGRVDQAGAAVTLAALSTPPIDWFALAAPLSLLAAGGVNLICAVT